MSLVSYSISHSICPSTFVSKGKKCELDDKQPNIKNKFWRKHRRRHFSFTVCWIYLPVHLLVVGRHMEGTWTLFLKSFHLQSSTEIISALHPTLFTSCTLHIICTKNFLGKYYINSMFLFIWFYFALDNNDTNGFCSLSASPHFRLLTND